jgi:hypothetical protein
MVSTRYYSGFVAGQHVFEKPIHYTGTYTSEKEAAQSVLQYIVEEGDILYPIIKTKYQGDGDEEARKLYMKYIDTLDMIECIDDVRSLLKNGSQEEVEGVMCNVMSSTTALTPSGQVKTVCPRPYETLTSYPFDNSVPEVFYPMHEWVPDTNERIFYAGFIASTRLQGEIIHTGIYTTETEALHSILDVCMDNGIIRPLSSQPPCMTNDEYKRWIQKENLCMQDIEYILETHHTTDDVLTFVMNTISSVSLF